MSDLKHNPTLNDMQSIKSPEIIWICATIKNIQHRMKQPDVVNLEYIRVYDKLGKEFNDFFEKYTGIFVKVIKGESLSTLASVLYYRDQMLQGLITEAQLADKLATKYLPAALKADSDIKLAEMQKNNQL